MQFHPYRNILIKTFQLKKFESKSSKIFYTMYELVQGRKKVQYTVYFTHARDPLRTVTLTRQNKILG